MTKLIQSALLSLALIAGAASANAVPSYDNSAMHDYWIGR